MRWTLLILTIVVLRDGVIVFGHIAVEESLYYGME
jgi:hypothetical protein